MPRAGVEAGGPGAARLTPRRAVCASTTNVPPAVLLSHRPDRREGWLASSLIGSLLPDVWDLSQVRGVLSGKHPILPSLSDPACG